MKRFLMVICALLLLSASVNATPILNPNNGHYYEVINFHGSWDDYYDASLTSTYSGLQGHLATVTSALENQWLVCTFGGNALNAHLFGGTDKVQEGTWEWVTGETWDYTNWAGGEPNNSGNEDYVEFWNNNGTWNDIWFSGGYHDGYVLEYEQNAPVPEPATMILFGLGLLGLAGVGRKKQK